jgi:predicted ATPase
MRQFFRRLDVKAQRLARKSNAFVEANALSNQAQNLANEANTVQDNTTNPKDADEQNVAGM